MLSINYPSLLPSIRKFSYGLMPVFINTEEQFSLVIKVTKEAILAARLNNEIKVYLLDNAIGPATHIGFITAFFDDLDEPLVIKSPQFAGDELLNDLTQLFGQEEFNLFFFDEHDRELMGVRAINQDASRFRSKIKLATFPEPGHPHYQASIKSLEHRFGIREAADDDKAFTIKLGHRLYPDDLIITDLRSSCSQFNRSDENFVFTTLERENPGPYQERDIAVMLNRVFEGKSIYLNPFRDDTGKELTDILVVTDNVMLFIQAKDSPNTKAALQRNIDRKRSIIHSHIDKAVKQLKGALSYALENDSITIREAIGPITINVQDRQLFGLVVVREMFDDDYPACSTPVLSVVRDLDLPVVLLDYSALHVISHNIRTPASFINGLYVMLDMARDLNQFPKPVWNGPPPESECS